MLTSCFNYSIMCLEMPCIQRGQIDLAPDDSASNLKARHYCKANTELCFLRGQFGWYIFHVLLLKLNTGVQ